jgi:tetratricopeptide (TPR) repeat protein
MLLECAQHINTKAVYDVYLKLAYLYLDKEEYDKMMVYTDKILRSNDSYWMYCCYRLLYLMCHQQGLYDDANRYYELYRQNVEKRAIEKLDNWDIEIPLKQKNTLLIEENRVLSGWKLWQTIGIVTVVVASGVIFLFVKRRHLRYLLEKNQELTDASSNIWKLKGAMTNQAHVVERLKKAMGDMKKEHRDEICRMREGMKRLETDIKELKYKERDNDAEKEELKRQLTDLEKQLKRKTDILKQTEEQRKIDLRIDYFVMHGHDSVAVDMLLQLRYGDKVQAKYDIRPSEYLPMLQGLLEAENPILHHQLEGCGLNRNKLTMCYLIALGLDDIDMMARAACLAPNSVKAYRKECREVVSSY